MKLIHRGGGCNDGPCPNVFDLDTEPELVAIQGATLTDTEALNQLPRKPEHESLVLVPRELILDYARKIQEDEVLA
jgi:hypothetical protein